MSQQTQDVDSMLVERWSTVYDAGLIKPTLIQHLVSAGVVPALYSVMGPTKPQKRTLNIDFHPCM